jgi:hypothetical protein
MVNFCTVCGCCTRTNIVREHLEDALRICDVSAMGLLYVSGYRDGGGGGGGWLKREGSTRNDIVTQWQGWVVAK